MTYDEVDDSNIDVFSEHYKFRFVISILRIERINGSEAIWIYFDKILTRHAVAIDRTYTAIVDRDPGIPYICLQNGNHSSTAFTCARFSLPN